MYVNRPDLEKQLIRSLRKNIHTFLFGESGNGKSWLFQNVLNKEKFLMSLQTAEMHPDKNLLLQK